MTEYEVTEMEFRNVSPVTKLHVNINKTVLRDNKIYYAMEVKMPCHELYWVVYHRYSAFSKLRGQLLDYFTMEGQFNACFGCQWFARSLKQIPFPRKRFLSSYTDDSIYTRKMYLNHFAMMLSTHNFSAIPKCTKCSAGPFRNVRQFFTQGYGDPPPSKDLIKLLAPETFSAIADPLKSKIEFRKGRSVIKVMQVNIIQNPNTLEAKENDLTMIMELKGSTVNDEIDHRTERESMEETFVSTSSLNLYKILNSISINIPIF